MQMNDSQRIEAPRQKVWEALNDPDVLKASIPGCEELVKHSDTEMEAKVKLKVGPVKATFGGKVTLNDLDPPNGYTIEGEGSGGVAGFARGGAKIRLEEDGPDATILNYEVDAKVGGKLAQLGARLIDSTSKRLAGEFFAAFAEQVAPTEPAEHATEEINAEAPEQKKGWLGGLFGGKKADPTAEEPAA
ncbi:carbon monoxide dehydrogenase subunit G [Labrenzia sp. EL_142]|nr:carbon monoxide dehydrogenase subunit G [Labrenzia sp. EL_142]